MREVEKALEAHESVCTERWTSTFFRITRLEKFILLTLCTVIVGGVGVMGTLVVMLKDAGLK
jgi:cell division protein FtsL